MSGRFWISAAAAGLELTCLASPEPDADAAAQMATKEGSQGGPSALCVMCSKGPISGSYFELEEGQCHSECHEAYDLERKKSTAAKCEFCHERILDSTWSVFSGDDGGKINIHKSCADGYQESKAPKCEQCTLPLTGGYCVLGAANLHQDCVDAYREAQVTSITFAIKSITFT